MAQPTMTSASEEMATIRTGLGAAAVEHDLIRLGFQDQLPGSDGRR